MDVLLPVGALALGAVLSLVFGAFLLKKHSFSLVTSVTVIRQTVGIAYLALLFFLCRKNGWNVLPVLCGGAVGFTLPSFFVTARLLKESAKEPPRPSERIEDSPPADNTDGTDKTDKTVETVETDEADGSAKSENADRSEEHHG